MPLMLIGLILLIGLLVYAVINYMRGDEEKPSSRRSFPRKDPEGSDSEDEDSKVLFFPTDHVELEKRKRNIK